MNPPSNNQNALPGGPKEGSSGERLEGTEPQNSAQADSQAHGVTLVPFQAVADQIYNAATKFMTASEPAQQAVKPRRDSKAFSKRKKSGLMKISSQSRDWERIICKGQATPADILHYFLYHDTKRKADKKNPELRFSEWQIRDQVFRGKSTEKTIRGWLHWLDDKQLISITRKSNAWLANGMPDTAAYINVNAARVEDMRQKVMESGGETPEEMKQLTDREIEERRKKARGKVTGRENETKNDSQQVQNQGKPEQVPFGNVTVHSDIPVQIPKEISSLSSLRCAPETKAEDRPAAPGPTPEDEEDFLKKEKTTPPMIKNDRNNVWRIHTDPVPPNDDALYKFSRDRWGMRLAHLLNIQTIGHQEARSFNTRITNGTLGTLEFLWLVLVWYPRNTGTYSGSIVALLKRFPGQLESPDSSARRVLDKALVDLLITSNNPREISDMKEQIVFLCDVTKSLPMTDAQIPDMEAWASLWRCYVTLRKTDVAEADKMKARYFTHLLVQEGYPAMEEEAGQEDQPEDPEEPASEPECNSGSETATGTRNGNGAPSAWEYTRLPSGIPFMPPPHPCPEKRILNPDSYD
jgi:hypothetical protein